MKGLEIYCYYVPIGLPWRLSMWCSPKPRQQYTNPHDLISQTTGL